MMRTPSRSGGGLVTGRSPNLTDRQKLPDRSKATKIWPPLALTPRLHAYMHSGSHEDLRATRSQSRRVFDGLPWARYSHEPLSDRIWELRHNFSAFDATFVSLSELLDIPLITSDARMAAAPGHRARIESFARV